MKVKLFTTGTGKGKPRDRFRDLEAEVNSWLEDQPTVKVEFAHRLSQPTFGWGQLALAVWYSDTTSSESLTDV